MGILLEILKIIGYICVFLIILYLAQWTSKYLARKNEFLHKNKKIKIVERLFLGKDKEVILLQYKEKEYLLGISQDKFTKIDTFKLKDDNNEKI
ncbi:flagellar biosynthetic protein FliO [Tepidibacter formicigenes]|jgi:flagellar protein FliO/FliZ|uniref:Flagellar protein FliO/FliZ n=1 Tax=Tepidibacter formicigenes DSM 15518 TaxID=1123349 RepID=A0A1M6JA05_9FIRM|nr:flagellar biosynthetic protein FliO [Tepidibacter formicigenes]SHJ43546.1 flagellar protein FliO/FliZ [Tepidibacter formicigenes DSM 15518]